MDESQLSQELLRIFQAELEENLSVLNHGLLQLEAAQEPKEIEGIAKSLFRQAHNMKGAAGTVGIAEIGALAHQAEDALSEVLDLKLPLRRELLDAFFQMLDLIQDTMDAHLDGTHLPDEKYAQVGEQLKDATTAYRISQEDGKAGVWPSEGPVGQRQEPIPPAFETTQEKDGQPGMAVDAIPGHEIQPAQEGRGGSQFSQRSRETIRVFTDKLDALMNSLGELLVIRMRSEQREEEVLQLQQDFLRWQKQWRRVRFHYNRLQHWKALRGQEENLQAADVLPLLDFLELNQETIRKMSGALNGLATNSISDNNRMELLTDDLQSQVRQVRMQPLSTILDTYPRLVRDLAIEQGKDIALDIQGAEIEVDRMVLEAMKDPLVHILRNAIGHGIEARVERKALGKTARGQIRLKASQQGTSMVLEISDDGAGMAPEILRKTAVKKGILKSQQADGLSDHDAIELIFRPSFSTQEKVDGLSGRGVGMSVVRKSLESLNGLVQVDTRLQHGTTFTLTVPLSLATSHVLLVKESGQVFGVMIRNIERIVWVDEDRVGSVEGKPVVVVDEIPLPYFSLAGVLGLKSGESGRGEGEKIPAIVLGVAERRAVFRVDEFFGSQEVVIKKLGSQLRRVRNVLGGSILGSGQVVIILNALDLLRTSQGAPIDTARREFEEKQKVHSVLLADDSITTRTLEKNILENAGYKVTTAADGLEAWEFVQSEPFDIIVSDVNMPRMDGFELTEKVNTDQRFSNLPVVLVTSLESQVDKVRGLDAGADAYIVKRDFDQQDLLEIIEQLIG